MSKFLKPLIGLNIVVATVVLVLGVRTLFHLTWQPTTIGILLMGGSVYGIAIFGWLRTAPYLVAFGALGTAILFPTPYGIYPMIIGFIATMLLLSLNVAITFFEEK